MRMLTRPFLEVLFPEGGFIESRALSGPEVRQDFACSIPSVLAFFYRVKATEDVYFGVAARATPKDGTKANLAYAAALWVDIDAEDADERLLQSGLPAPSIIVASGTRGHRQAYWLLRVPYQLRTPQAVADLEARLRGIACAAGGDHACVDAGRVLRMPNSRNFKHTPATYVDIVSWLPDLRYEVNEFPLGEVVTPTEVVLTDAVEPTRAVETEWVQDILDNGYEGQWNRDKSAVDFKVAYHLLVEGFSPEETLWLCTESEAIGKRKRNWRTYWPLTIANAAKRLRLEVD
jgi:hypothetical protein